MKGLLFCVCARVCVCVDISECLWMCKTSVCLCTDHGYVLSSLLELVLDLAGDVSEVGQGELLKLYWPQTACVGLEHLEGLRTQRKAGGSHDTG